MLIKNFCRAFVFLKVQILRAVRGNSAEQKACSANSMPRAIKLSNWKKLKIGWFHAF